MYNKFEFSGRVPITVFEENPKRLGVCINGINYTMECANGNVANPMPNLALTPYIEENNAIAEPIIVHATQYKFRKGLNANPVLAADAVVSTVMPNTFLQRFLVDGPITIYSEAILGSGFVIVVNNEFDIKIYYCNDSMIRENPIVYSQGDVVSIIAESDGLKLFQLCSPNFNPNYILPMDDDVHVFDIAKTSEIIREKILQLTGNGS